MSLSTQNETRVSREKFVIQIFENNFESLQLSLGLDCGQRIKVKNPSKWLHWIFPQINDNKLSINTKPNTIEKWFVQRRLNLKFEMNIHWELCQLSPPIKYSCIFVSSILFSQSKCFVQSKWSTVAAFPRIIAQKIERSAYVQV